MTKKYNLDNEDPNKVFFVGDPHFDHTNIIGYCNRPFNTTSEMNALMLKNWNYTIGSNDLVFFLGDMAFGRGSNPPSWWLEYLNGRIIYLKGSHDHGIRTDSNGINALFVVHYIIVEVNGLEIFLVHDDMYHSEAIKWEGWMIHGHNHNNRPHINFKKKRVNVSVEAINYTPITLSAILSKIGVK